MTSDATVGAPGGPGELSCPFGASPPPVPGARPRPKRGYLLPGTIALVVCALIAVVIDVAGLQSHTPRTLAAGEVETLVSQSIQATHPQRNPPDVRCPGSEPIRAGVSFDCTLLRAGHPPSRVAVAETSGDGTLRVSVPSA